MSKKILFIYFIACLFSCKQSNQSDVAPNGYPQKKQPINTSDSFLTDLTDTKKLLNFLYQSTEFDTLKTIRWSPNQQEYPEIPVCFDLSAHTGIDTILFFTNSNGIESAAVILANYNLGLDNDRVVPTGGHFSGLSLGVALFENRDGQWKVYCFKKHLAYLGYYGTYRTGNSDQGQISLKKLGRNWTGLSFKQGIGGSTGEFWGTETWFSIEPEEPKFNTTEKPAEINVYGYTPLKQIFTYNYSHTYYFPDLENENDIAITIKQIQTKSPIDDLKLTLRESNYNLEKQKNNSSVSKTRFYNYSPGLNLFIEK